MKIEDYSIEQLKQLQIDAAALIESKKEQALDNAFEKINTIAEEVGLTVLELLEYGNTKNKKRKPVEPRYRNKANAEETWTGRGKQPKWLVAEIEKGAKLEDFLI